MVMWGDMGLFSRAFLDQNLFISSFAVVPIGAALQGKTKNGGEQKISSTLLQVFWTS